MTHHCTIHFFIPHCPHISPSSTVKVNSSVCETYLNGQVREHYKAHPLYLSIALCPGRSLVCILPRLFLLPSMRESHAHTRAHGCSLPCAYYEGRSHRTHYPQPHSTPPYIYTSPISLLSRARLYAPSPHPSGLPLFPSIIFSTTPRLSLLPLHRKGPIQGTARCKFAAALFTIVSIYYSCP